MDTSNIIKGVVNSGRYTVTAPIVKEDYGLYLQIEGVELPSTYEVDFSNSEHNGTSVTMIGNSDGVLIPHQFIDTGKDIFAFLYHVGADFGRTVYKFRIPNKVRPDRTEETPTPEEQSVIDQTISALNDAVDRVEDAEQAIEDMSVSATTLAEGESATVTKTESEGVVHLAFGIPKGATGDTPTITASKTGKTTSIYVDGSEVAQVEDGTDGTDGDDGYSPTASVTKSGKVATITITDKNGTTSAQVEDGEDGATGATPNLTIGTVETLEPTESATATITGTPENPVLNLGIPQGDTGEVTQAEFDELSGEVSDLKEDLTTNLDLFNCTDLLRKFATYNSNEKDGVTFTWNDDHTVCNANGSTTKTTCYNVLYSSVDTLPSQLVAGETYIFRVNTTASTNLRLYMYQYHSDSSLNGYSYIISDTSLTLPSTLIGLVLRIQVKSNTSVSNDKISVFITKTKTNAELASDLSELSQPRGLLASNVALNDVTDEGVWLLDSATDYTNSPLPHGKAGTLEVFKDGICIVQRLTRYDGESVYFRTSNTHGSFTNRDWHEEQGGNTYNNTYTTQVYENDYNITCSPTITTDTNNFLASTGDSTDRTSAIQTMLNSTGICRLGPGDFYVTGVTIPDFGALVGSGNATRLILDSSVTTGCAINLSNNCVVKDMRIVGQATGTYTGQSTVGTRHGILWTATADAASPTRKRRCIIDNCEIWYFAGGAITCSNVGGNIDSNLLISNCFIYGCDAGINIAYYSEFHRITNVSATHCYYGCICNGGNCNFVNCSFSYNMVGILMDNSTGQSPNNSHGVFSACTVCHSGANNDGIAIKVLNCDNGEIFTGLQIHFGSIIVDDSTAIRFVGCQFGRSVPMTLTNNTVITFSDCSISDVSTGAVTQSGNTAIVFDKCYKYDGTTFDPTT